MIGNGAAMQRDLRQGRARPRRRPGRVLITGENGTGKELVARAIHEHSQAQRRAVREAQLRGDPGGADRERAVRPREGRVHRRHAAAPRQVRAADGGTLFLDEIGDMNPSAQAKVLRVLQENELERVGGGETINVDVRVRRRDQQRSAAGDRRGRGFARICTIGSNVVPIEVPPLRERREDIPALVEHFLERCAQTTIASAQEGRVGRDDAAHAARLAGQRARAQERRRAARDLHRRRRSDRRGRRRRRAAAA